MIVFIAFQRLYKCRELLWLRMNLSMRAFSHNWWADLCVATSMRFLIKKKFFKLLKKKKIKKKNLKSRKNQRILRENKLFKKDQKYPNNRRKKLLKSLKGSLVWAIVLVLKPFWSNFTLKSEIHAKC